MTLVIPCFNEAGRLDRAGFLRIRELRPAIRLLFVDDGSTDRTFDLLDGMRSAAASGAIEVLRLPENSGKGEAVRAGLLAALATDASIIGYADADLATPPEELVRLVDDMSAAPVPVSMGARVRMLGTRIERHPLRHYLGRVFATLASIALGVGVYDTQCGAKLFRRTDALSAALSRPFRSRWAFDVELLDRLLTGAEGVRPLSARDMREVPLRAWRNVRGSKIGPPDMLLGGLQLVALVVRSAVRRLRRREER